MSKPRVEAWPVWEVECPECGEIQETRFSDDDFYNNEVGHTCESCRREFIVEKPTDY